MLRLHLLNFLIGQAGQQGMCCCDVSVVQFGADPTGAANSTGAFQQARAATQPGQSICIPQGTFTINPDFWVIDGRQWIGAGGGGTIVRPSGAGTWLARLQNNVNGGSVVGVLADGLSLVQDGWFLDQSVGRFERCSARGFTRAGWHHFENAFTSSINCSASQNPGAGFLIRGGNANTFLNCHAISNTGIGIDWVGPASTTDPGIVTAGASFWYGGGSDVNLGATQVRFRGVEGAYMAGVYIEGSDGLHLDENTRTCTFEHLRFVGGGLVQKAVRLIDASSCTFVGCSAPNDDTHTGFGQFRVSPASQVNNFIGCHRATFIAFDYMDVVFEDGIGGEYICIPRETGLHVENVNTAPTFGTWQQGQIIWKNNPAAATRGGFICVAGGTPGTWREFADIQP